jgi:hypothetical protein
MNVEAIWSLVTAALETLAGAAGTDGAALLGVTGLALATKLLVDLAKKRWAWLKGPRTPAFATGLAIAIALIAHAAYKQDAWALAVMQGILAGGGATALKVWTNVVASPERRAAV